MQTNNKASNKATNVTTSATVVTTATGVTVAKQVANNAIVRLAQRVAAVQAQRKAKHAARVHARNRAAYQLAAAELAAQYGVQAPAFNIDLLARANSATVAPSRELVYVGGTGYKPCKAVHALCATLPANATRAEQLQLCKDNGINAATSSTQVGLYRKAAAAAAAAAAAEQE